MSNHMIIWVSLFAITILSACSPVSSRSVFPPAEKTMSQIYWSVLHTEFEREMLKERQDRLVWFRNNNAYQ